MRPIIWHSQGLSEEVLITSFTIEQNIGFRRNNFLKVIDQLDILIIEVVPVSAGMVPCVSIVMALSHGT